MDGVPLCAELVEMTCYMVDLFYDVVFSFKKNPIAVEQFRIA